MKYLALDLSTKTGYAVFDGDTLIEYGLIKSEKKSHYKSDVKSYKDLGDNYPLNFINTAKEVTRMCKEVYTQHKCEFAVIEHTETGKARLSQRLLEWINYAVANEFLERGIPIKYLFVSEWRNATKCYLKYWPEHKLWNTKINKLKAKATPTKSGAKIAKIDGKIVTKVDQKKLSIIIANEAYGITIKDDNIADAINLGRAAFKIFRH